MTFPIYESFETCLMRIFVHLDICLKIFLNMSSKNLPEKIKFPPKRRTFVGFLTNAKKQKNKIVFMKFNMYVCFGRK